MNIAKISLVWSGKLKTASLPIHTHSTSSHKINFRTWAHECIKTGYQIYYKGERTNGFATFQTCIVFCPAEHVVSFWYFRVKSVGIFNLSRMDILLPLWRHAGPPKDKNLSSSDLNIFTLEQHYILKKTQATRVWRSYILVLRVIVLSLPAKQYSLSAQSSDICDGVQPPASTTEPQSHQYNPPPTHPPPHTPTPTHPPTPSIPANTDR